MSDATANSETLQAPDQGGIVPRLSIMMFLQFFTWGHGTSRCSDS